jgi:hypothetical protein
MDRIAERNRSSGELASGFITEYLVEGRDVSTFNPTSLIGGGVSAGEPRDQSDPRGFLDPTGFFSGRDTVDMPLDLISPKKPLPPLIPSLFCRKRGGTAFLFGFDETPGYASSPPKKFLTMSLGGTITLVGYYGGTPDPCTSPNGQEASFSLAGSCSYDALTGVYTADATWSRPGPGTLLGPIGSGSQSCASRPSVPYSFWGTTLVYTATTAVLTGLGTCVPHDDMGEIIGGSNTCTLSNEDTEGNALTRLWATSAGVWGSWCQIAPTDSINCDPTLPENPAQICCLASYQQRTGFSFAYVEAQYKITATGLLPGVSYTVNLKVWRSLYGVDSYSLFETLPVSGFADSGGNLDIEGDVPTQVGYDTYVTLA